MFPRTVFSSVSVYCWSFWDIQRHRLTEIIQAFRPLSRPANFLQPHASIFRAPSFLHARLLSNETKSAIEKAVGTAPVVLFMKGTPETPQCGFSRASIQILGLQGVDPKKFVAFNVLEDVELRQGKPTDPSCRLGHDAVS